MTLLTVFVTVFIAIQFVSVSSDLGETIFGKTEDLDENFIRHRYSVFKGLGKEPKLEKEVIKHTHIHFNTHIINV